MSGLVLTVHATCANVVGKVTIGLDVPPPPTILVGKELRPAATACRRFRTHNKIISECDVSSWRAGVLPAIPAGGAFAGRGGDLGAPVSYLGTEPLQLGPLVGAQRSIVRHSATFLLANTMAPSPMEMDAVITQIV